MTEIEQLQEQINELKSMVMELRTTMKQHIEVFPDYVER